MSAEQLTRALGGRWHGHYGLAFCPAHENHRTPALSLADGRDGKLLVKCFAGCDAIDVLRRIDGRASMAMGFPRELIPRPARPNLDRRAFALNLWYDARPVGGTVAERYLRGRAIRRPLPPSLRCHPHVKHGPSQSVHPAMIALVVAGDDRKPLGVQRTYLTPFGKKADLSPARMMLGRCGSGAVRLRDASAGALVVCEGIETGLSLCDELEDGRRVWAALSTSGIAALKLPNDPDDLVIAPDGDAPGQQAAERLAGRADALGWTVRIMQAPPSQDWNDVAQAAGGGARP